MRSASFFYYEGQYVRMVQPRNIWQRRAERYVRGKGFEPVSAEEVLHKGRPISRREFQEATVLSCKYSSSI